MTKPSTLSRLLVGSIADFANRYCIVCFTETHINLVMLSRISNLHVTEGIIIPRNEIEKLKLSDVLISYMLNLKTNDSSMKFQVFKIFGKFSKTKSSLELFKNVYHL